MTLALVGLTVRSDLLGVTSVVRAVWLRPCTYKRLLHMFHTPALAVQKLTTLWIRLSLKLFDPLKVQGRLVLVADGLKVAKEGRKMPAVKKLHQESGDNSKPEFIFGHSFQAVGLLVKGPQGHVASVPLASRIHEGLVFSNRDRRTLLDRLVGLFTSITRDLQAPAILVADAYYASRKIILPLLAEGHHLVTRVRSNSVAFQEARKPTRPKRGRPRIYGSKVILREVWRDTRRFTSAVSPVYQETGVMLSYYSLDLLWRPVGRVVRFVFVVHPSRGRIILMTSDTSMDPLQVIALYGYRFKIEASFKQALHTLGSYAYHFWMMDMQPIPRRSGNQYLHKQSRDYRRLVRRKMDAYHRYVQLGCIAQGLLQHLSLNFRTRVWRHFKSWMRTMKPSKPPSEAVVAQALRASLPELIVNSPGDHELTKFIVDNADLSRCQGLHLAA